MPGLTNFPNGVSSFGLPVIGVPFQGNYWFVNETSGLDGNSGKSPSQAFGTLTHALAMATPANNDVIFIEGSVHVTATVAWNLDQTHLIGTNAPGEIAQRSRISQTGATEFTPLVHVTGSGCYFANLGTFHGYSTAAAQICWTDSGQRNVYDHVTFGGMGNAAGAAAQAGSRNLLIDGGTGQATPTSGYGEHLFYRCTVGLDTITRGANASLEILGASPRNIFRECEFIEYAGGSTTLHFKLTAADAIDRFVRFDNCTFINAIQSQATTAAQAFSIAASCGGLVLLKSCITVGSTAWETTPSNECYIDMPVPNTAGGQAINN